jgi:hypothetical protein
MSQPDALENHSIFILREANHTFRNMANGLVDGERFQRPALAGAQGIPRPDPVPAVNQSWLIKLWYKIAPVVS